MNKIDPADEVQLFATIDRWVEREVAPRVKEFDHADKWPAELVEQMKELGLFGATVSPEYGGLGLPATTYAQIVMKIPPPTQITAAPTWNILKTVYHCASAAKTMKTTTSAIAMAAVTTTDVRRRASAGATAT